MRSFFHNFTTRLITFALTLTGTLVSTPATFAGTELATAKPIFQGVFVQPYQLTCDPILKLEGQLVRAGVLTGLRGTGENASLIVNAITPVSARLSLGEVTGEPLEIEGILIGNAGSAVVAALLIPVDDEHPEAPTRWAAVIMAPQVSLFSNITARTGWYISPSEYCQMNCAAFAIGECGNQPTCSPNPANDGIQACMDAAGCRLDICMWAVCVNDRACQCNWYQARCQAYYNKFGVWPPANWAPGTPLSCGGVTGSTACLAVYVLEVTACLPSCILPW